MTCRVCGWIRDWLGFDPEIDCAQFWAEVHDWEGAHSNDAELWAMESDANRELIEQVWAIEDTDPEEAFRMALRAADAGSVWGMRLMAWHYHAGSVVPADPALALDYYYRAACAGSWMATIPYAQLLAQQGHIDACEETLQDGIRSDFVPAYFRLAASRLERSSSRRTYREVRPLLEYAADRGHPGAKRLLARALLLGKYGIRQLPTGFRMMREIIGENGAHEPAGAGPVETAPIARDEAPQPHEVVDHRRAA